MESEVFFANMCGFLATYGIVSIIFGNTSIGIAAIVVSAIGTIIANLTSRRDC